MTKEIKTTVPTEEKQISCFSFYSFFSFLFIDQFITLQCFS